MKHEDLMKGLEDAGVQSEETDHIVKLYESDRHEDVLHSLKRCRADMLAELHERQKNIDVIDYLIRNC